MSKVPHASEETTTNKKKRDLWDKTDQSSRKLETLSGRTSKIEEQHDAFQPRHREPQQTRHIVDGRWHGRESLRDPSPLASNLSNTTMDSSNESSVDPWTVAEHKRPVDVPLKPSEKSKRDQVDVVEDLSDREDDPSTGEVEVAPPDEDLAVENRIDAERYLGDGSKSKEDE